MQIGLALYMVKKSMREDSKKTFKAIADMGYHLVEGFPQYDVKVDKANYKMDFTQLSYGFNYPAPADPKEEKKFLDDLGIIPWGVHIGDEVVFADDLEPLKRNVDYLAQIGLINFGHPGTDNQNMDAIKRHCERYNLIGQMCKDAGMRFHFHTTFTDFQQIEGRRILDLLLEGTDPELVDYELDVFWASRGGADPVECIEQYKNRLCGLHFKDFPKDTGKDINLFKWKYKYDQFIPNEQQKLDSQPEWFCQIGDGMIDFQAIIDKANECNIPGALVEQDHSPLSELECSKANLDAVLAKYTGIHA